MLITRIRWFHVPLTFAFTFVGLGQLRKYRIRNIPTTGPENGDQLTIYKASHLEVAFYCLVYVVQLLID